MKLKTTRTSLASEITGLAIETDKFKTTRITLSFVLPLSPLDASLASILTKLLTRSTAEYPTAVALQRKLLSLYGARFSSYVSKLGDNQLLNISISFIHDRFALGQQSISRESTDFLCKAVFSPNMINEQFDHNDFEVCRRLLLESIESSINDKRKYAISKLYSLMCDQEPFGIEPGGDIATAKKIEPKQAAEYWANVLKTAPVIITVIGNQDASPIFQQILGHFDRIDRSPCSISPCFDYKHPRSVREYAETMQLTQGKLVMGFRSPISSINQDNMALRMMCDIWGGAPYSKLFTVVREQQSLCYYCAARLISPKGILCVDSGVDNENIIAARQGILDQLTAIQQGDFDQDVIDACQMSMADGATSVTDTPSSIEAWYLARIFNESMENPDEFIARLHEITKEDIIAAAKTVTLDTVYVLQGQEERK